ncbi:sigma-fimbriae subunit [Yersinia frederiksenii]|uniref:Sigma-fimbriae subunit n=2 Tax=Yersinia frederiksenii TaxID=29484 RepID=A0A380PQP3_YERFR|nr:spore coat U domain-containing protein [Yersinia frederiksenii]ATM96062.1 spore coat protein U [Yersinia frederiksenii]EEQ16470.1 Spore coat U domain protein [Yersinia frederiksenii ATCC 33641]KGA44420.1 spore Coat Protein U domain protein [Yersinia frederiksenii ATCC 33641]MDN0119002.1 spore coat U domain-containing protein [Yersinia frederiksenii]CNC41069.1 sigma-fimbriae subunit [Yersinia frederiksenii]
MAHYCFYPACVQLLVLALLGLPGASSYGDTLSRPFAVKATILPGCILGSGTADSSSFGTLNFGNVSSLSTAINVASSQNAGSIIIQCSGTPSLSLALNSGANTSGNIASGRRLLNSATGEYLFYQIFQDSARSVVWGNGSNGGSAQVITANSTLQQVILYAQLFASSTLPTAGNYTDTLLVTITY